MGLTVSTGCSMTVDEGSLLEAATPVEAESIGSIKILSPTQRQELINCHTALVLADCGRGETDLVELSIDTEPRRCAPRRMPFVVRKEVARQLKAMFDHHSQVKESMRPKFLLCSWNWPLTLMETPTVRPLRIC